MIVNVPQNLEVNEEPIFVKFKREKSKMEKYVLGQSANGNFKAAEIMALMNANFQKEHKKDKDKKKKKHKSPTKGDIEGLLGAALVAQHKEHKKKKDKKGDKSPKKQKLINPKPVEDEEQKDQDQPEIDLAHIQDLMRADHKKKKEKKKKKHKSGSGEGSPEARE